MTAADTREGTCPSGSGHPPGGIESYHRLVSMAGEPAAITNLEGTVLICNPKTASLLGFNNSAELIGRNALDLVAGEDRDRARAGIERILGEGEVRGKQLTLVRRDGGRVRVEVNLASIADEENIPLRLVSLVPSIANSLPDAEESQSSAADLESKLAECNAELEKVQAKLSAETARREQLEQQLRDRDAEGAVVPYDLSLILEHLPVGVFLAEGEAEGRTVRWKLTNRAGRNQLNAPTVTPGVVSETFTVYHPDGTLFAEDDLPIQAALWTGKEAVAQPMLFRYHNGEERTLEATTYILCEEAGTRQVVEVLVDVTDRDRARQNLDRERDDFIALVSHELRTPITTIKASSQLGMRGTRKADDDRTTRLLNTINEQSDRMTRLIDDLLESSRVQGSGLSLHVAPVDMRELVNRVLDEQESTAPGFSITRALPEQEVSVNTDPQRIEQVLVNLIQNAIKYAGSSRRIDVAVYLEDGHVVTAVRDYGVGIPTDQQARIFERFFRARNADGQNSRGLGLGLYIAQGIVARLGGRMWLQSAEGEGSTFYFALPVVSPERSV